MEKSQDSSTNHTSVGHPQKISTVSMQKIASLPSLASGLISPASVAKATLSSKHATSENTENQASFSQQLAMLNNTGNNTNILIKTTKTNSSGQPTYVAISIPTHTSPSGQKQTVPLTIHQVKLKQGTENDNEEKVSSKKIDTKGIFRFCLQ